MAFHFTFRGTAANDCSDGSRGGAAAWRGQMRDMADNDDRTTADQMRDARAMEAFAASRAGQAGWAAHCGWAAAQAQAWRREARRRMAGASH